MGVISVRIPDALESELDAAGIRVSEVVKADLTQLTTSLRSQRREAILDRYRRVASRSVADLVREARSDH
jgi:hypothetical protein